MRRWLVIVAALGSLVACGDDDDWKDRRVPSATPPLSIGAAQQRPAAVVLPEDYDITKQYPLVILLHGFGVSGSIQDFLLQLSARTTSHQFILVLPDGTRNSADQRFWDATPECCNFTGAPVDDVGYLAALIEEASEIYAVDRSRVRLTGHSNGGYMSYRYICEHPIRVDRIAVLAGSTFIDAADCDDPEPVDILHMHGTNDQTILYDRNLPPDADSGAVQTIGAEAAVQRWAEVAGCDGELELIDRRDHHQRINIDGDPAETEVLRATGCDGDRTVELWRGVGADHTYLSINDRFRDQLAEFLSAP